MIIDGADIFQGISFPEAAHFYSNGLAIWRSLPDIMYGLALWHNLPDNMHTIVSTCHTSAIFYFIKIQFFMAYPYLQPHILFSSIGPSIWHGLQIKA